jgi:hypothetical protein
VDMIGAQSVDSDEKYVGHFYAEMFASRLLARLLARIEHLRCDRETKK